MSNNWEVFRLREKCSYLELFWSEFSHTRTKYGEISVCLRIQSECRKMQTRITFFTQWQALEAIGKLKEINGSVRLTLGKLNGMRTELVRMDNGWQQWKFPQLVEALQSWTRRNPITSRDNEIQKSFKANKFKVECVYCD